MACQKKRNVRTALSVAINVAINLKKDHKNNIFIPFARIEGVECSHVVLKVCIDEFKSKSVFSKFLLTLPGQGKTLLLRVSILKLVLFHGYLTLGRRWKAVSKVFNGVRT